MNTLMNPEAASTADFRNAMRRVASTVHIVTATDGSYRHGMTMTAVSSLSMDPPSMIVCINKSTLLHEIMLAARRFCINSLCQSQEPISAAFSGKISPEERFGIGQWGKDNDGLDYLVDAQSNLFCRKVAAVPFGTHTIFIGVVEQTMLNDDVKPLIYQNATYC